MFKPSVSGIWDELAAHRNSLEDFNMASEFALHGDRFERMHARGAGLLLDYSKNLVTDATMGLLIKAAEEINLRNRIYSLFTGGKVNSTEDRPALHSALRDFTVNAPYHADINAAFSRMAVLVEQVHSGKWKGSTGHPITDVVNLGIGGSHLGPMMVSDALDNFSAGKIRCHFVSNIDREDIGSTLSRVDAGSTLFIICSKSFTTLETLQNATTARQWLESRLPAESLDHSKHFLAVTARPDLAKAFGISPDNVLPMWDWVGGRYSLWSAIGISIALYTGMENFHRLRRGAADMDQHFNAAPLAQNLPVILALLGIWYVNYWDTESHAVLPYVHRLRYLPEFLQQLEMESNGKSVNVEGKDLDYPTAPVIWGTVETNGQHSFHQLLHQGTRLIPVDFILELNPEKQDRNHHQHLLANCLAQSNALMVGKSHAEALQDLVDSGIEHADAERLAGHYVMPGNRPSTTIVMETLTPETLGALIALYEHKVYVQSVIWNINAFDQFGVELGKKIGKQVHERLSRDEVKTVFDSSTEGLIRLYKNVRAEE
jgi:glucose-6-phosphate isomerase